MIRPFEYKTLTESELLRSVEVNRGKAYSLFLGAGASITSNMPSVENCVWSWKKTIFRSDNPDLNNKILTSDEDSLRSQVQSWLDSKGGYPKLGSSEEYSFYAEECYPIGDDRRKYFRKLAEKAQSTPSIGYKLLCLLALDGFIRTIYTTNFDGLFPHTARNLIPGRLSIIEAGHDTNNRIALDPQSNELLYVSLHGDYRFDNLQNTDDELRELDKILSGNFVRKLRENSLIVVGYSGNDDSIMKALTKAYSSEGAGQLFWCGYKDPEPNKRIKQLLTVANKHGRKAYYITTTGFDDLMTRLASVCLTGELSARAESLRLLEKDNPESSRISTDTNATKSEIAESLGYSNKILRLVQDLIEIERSEVPISLETKNAIDRTADLLTEELRKFNMKRSSH